MAFALMRVEHLSLTNFRNYARLELSLPQQPLVLHGANAQGKTSLLEALYYLAAARSPYTRHDRQLIHWRTEDDPLPYARLSADFSNRQGRHQTLEMALVLENGTRFKKTIRHNHAEKRVMDVVGVLSVVLFLPQDLTLVEGSPADRRAWMDATLSQISAAYLAALEGLEKALPQRNALLRRIAERKAKPAELGYWDEQVAQFGAILIAERQKFLRELEYLAQRQHHALSGQRETLSLRYQPSFSPSATAQGQRAFEVFGLDLHRQLEPQDIAPQYLERLRQERDESIQRGATLSGPHRDELRLLINGRDCGLYGSRGQARTTVLALKLAELDWMEKALGEAPLLLLDEVIAELDAQRRAYLLGQIDGRAQTVLTTTELDIFEPSFLARAQVLHIREGQIVGA